MDDKRRQEKREERRRRRVRSQVLAYSALTIVILALAAGIACSVLRLMKAGQGAGQKEQENQELID